MLHLYLSPHLDDAVLSCGGTIAAQVAAGEPVRVVTLFAGDPPPGPLSPFAVELHRRWGLDEAPGAGRRAEDERALNLLGATAVHLSFPDAIYRVGPDGVPLYPSREAIFGPPHPVEAGLVDELARALAALNLPSQVRIYVPLGVGQHVDHVLTRRAAERWQPRGGEFWYYEEYPYAESPDQVMAALGQGAWREQLVPLTPAHLEARLAAIACYISQISSLFADLTEMRERVRAHAARLAQGQKPALSNAKAYAERFYQIG